MRNMIRNAWRSRWVTAATVLAVLLAACSGAADPGVSSGGNPASEKLAQDLSFILYQGAGVLGEGNLTVSSLQGKPLVLNFWAGLCPPCRAEMPDLQEFYEENKDRVNLLGIDVGQFTGLGNQESAKALLEERIECNLPHRLHQRQRCHARLQDSGNADYDIHRL